MRRSLVFINETVNPIIELQTSASDAFSRKILLRGARHRSILPTRGNENYFSIEDVKKHFWNASVRKEIERFVKTRNLRICTLLNYKKKKRSETCKNY